MAKKRKAAGPNDEGNAVISENARSTSLSEDEGSENGSEDVSHV